MIRKLFNSHSEGTSVFRNINVSLIVKSLSMVIGIVSVPIYRSFFGTEDMYGLWMAIVSILTWILFFDLGFGSGLRSKLGPLLDMGDKKKSKVMITSTYMGTLFVSIFLFIVSISLIWSLDFNSILNVPEGILTPNEIKVSMSILSFGLCIEFVLKNISFILYAQRRSGLAALLTLASTISLLSYFLIFQDSQIESKFIVSSIVYVTTVNVPLLFTTLIIFHRNKELRPKIEFFSLDDMKSIMSIGIVFFLIQMGFLFITQTDGVLITSFYSPASNAEYTYYSKIFVFFVGLMGSVVQQPIWSVIALAKKNNDVGKIRKYSKITLFIAIGIFVICVIAGLSMQFIFNLWLGQFAPQVNYFYIGVFVLNSFVFLIANSFVIIGNGLGLLKPQLWIILSSALLKIPLILLLYYFSPVETWINITIVNSVCYIPLMCILPLYIRKELK
ncbi:MAG: oligosaccharide flippase family protein [Acholeplasma sp.]|nr:oligosaccharide flippase family protein [Acholeplasma sp.]